ncbi:MAG: FkbM family methyltransferase [Acidimicrobiales bacterium]
MKVLRLLRRGGSAWSAGLRIASVPRRRNLLHNSRLDLLPAQELRRLGVVVDIGANVGDWSAAVLELAAPGLVLAVEPAPATAEQLRERFRSDARVRVVEAAVGACDGQTSFHVTKHSHSGSVVLAAGTHRHLLGARADVVADVDVEMVSLDSLLGDLHEISLLKIDVQGYERAVLAGAKAALAKTRWVLLEANFVHQYEGDALLPELVLTLEAAGFELTNMSEPLVAQGQALFADVVFHRRGE